MDPAAPFMAFTVPAPASGAAGVSAGALVHVLAEDLARAGAVAPHCSLLPGAFGVFIQGSLFLLCVGSLVLKKTCERSQRTWKEFGLDSSKQFAGAFLVHVLNMAFASLLVNGTLKSDACDWYFVIVLVDTTLGTLICYLLLKGMVKGLLPKILSPEAAQEFETGDYGHRDHVEWGRYWKQIGLWSLITITMKLIIAGLTIALRLPFRSISEYVLGPLRDDDKAKLAVVMIVTPMCANIFQFWVTDNFLMRADSFFFKSMKHSTTTSLVDDGNTTEESRLTVPGSQSAVL